jgi:hypothetical protein
LQRTVFGFPGFLIFSAFVLAFPAGALAVVSAVLRSLSSCAAALMASALEGGGGADIQISMEWWDGVLEEGSRTVQQGLVQPGTLEILSNRLGNRIDGA